MLTSRFEQVRSLSAQVLLWLAPPLMLAAFLVAGCLLLEGKLTQRPKSIRLNESIPKLPVEQHSLQLHAQSGYNSFLTIHSDY